MPSAKSFEVARCHRGTPPCHGAQPHRLSAASYRQIGVFNPTDDPAEGERIDKDKLVRKILFGGGGPFVLKLLNPVLMTGKEREQGEKERETDAEQSEDQHPFIPSGG